MPAAALGLELLGNSRCEYQEILKTVSTRNILILDSEK